MAMAEERHAAVWCKVLGKIVEVTLVRSHAGQMREPGVPEGWTVAECLDKDTDCYGRDCPFTTDGGEWPLSEPDLEVGQG
jgi:hypothetical protein